MPIWKYFPKISPKILFKLPAKFFSNFYNFVETLLKFIKIISLQTSIKFLQRFHKHFASVCGIIVTNYSHRFQQNFLAHFHHYFNSPHNFPKILWKNSFLFRHSSTTTLFINLTKITQHYFYKTYKIFEKFDAVSRTFSISFLSK